MDIFKVALLQIMPEGNLTQNLEKGMRYCKTAKAMGADLALFPEMWSAGYDIPESIQQLKENAILVDSDFMKQFSTLACELDMAIGITLLESYEPLPRNTLVVFDRFGNKILTYAKVHTCDFGDECRLTPGDDFYVANLNTAQGDVKIGAMICYDREFPESARILMLKGAEVILVPNACPVEINRISQLRARAFENMLGIATVNYPVDMPDCNGHSTAFDGIVYKPDAPSSRDTLIVEAGESEEIILAEFPISEMRAYRSSEVHGNAYRRPSKYAMLIAEAIEPPFIRSDYRK